MHLARSEGATIVAVTGEQRTRLSSEAQLVVRLPVERADGASLQPLGSLFEQALLLYLDGIVLRLMADLGKTPEDMERIHANLP
jgi:6-phospho-3-hexuloisomerase